MLAICLQGKVRVEGNPGHFEQTSLYVFIVANLLNAKGRLEEIMPLIRKLLPRIGKMKTQLEQYAQAFTAITEENKTLKKENEQLDTDIWRERQKALDSRFELGRLQEQACRLEQKLARIPPEILAEYSRNTSRQGQNRDNQPFL